MKSIKVIPALMILFLMTAFTAVQAGEDQQAAFKLPKYEKFVMPNGLTVYLMEQHEVPLIYFSAAVPAGAVFDKKSGIASMTADALMFGTKSYTKNQIEETFDFYGANLSTFATKESGRISSSFSKADREKLMPIIKEVIVQPVFDKTEFEKRKQRALVELKQDKESPRQVIKNYFDKFIYGSNIYSNPVSGSINSVSDISVEDVKNFYSAHYIPNTSVIALAGDFNTAEMKQYLTGLFGDWKSEGENIPVLRFLAPAEIKNSRVLLVNKPDARETTFLIGSFGIKQSNPDYVAVQVVNTVLGGRFTSWLNDELRVNSGYTYGARSTFNALRETGTFAVSTFTKTATTIDAIDLALKVLDKLQTQGLDESTLASAKNYLKGQFPPNYETAGELANLMVSMFVYGFNESFINDFQKNVDSLTLGKSKEIISKYFPRSNYQFVLIGKAADIKDKVAKYGPVTTKEITDDGF